MQCDTHLFTLVQVVQYDMFTITKVAIGISHTNKHFKANVNIILTAFPNNFGKMTGSGRVTSDSVTRVTV